MRWFVSGLAFALLVGLAMATVALRAVNIRSRARIEALEMQCLSRRVENDRWLELLRRGTRREPLQAAWRDLMARAAERLQ